MVARSAALASALALLAPVAASAQGETGADRETHFVALDVATARDVYPGGRLHDGRTFPASSSAALTFGVSSRLRAIGPARGRSGFLLDVELAMRGVVGESSSLGEWILHPGHADVGVMIGGRFREAVARGGIGTTLPLGMLGDRPNEARPLTGIALRALGAWDAATLLRDAVTPTLRGDIAFRRDWLMLGVEWAIGVVFDAGTPRDSIVRGVILQVGGWAGARIENVELGVRVSAVGSGFAPGFSPTFVALGFARLRLAWLSVEARGGARAVVFGETDAMAQVIVSAAVR